MQGITVNPTQDDVIIAHQARRITFLELQIEHVLRQNADLQTKLEAAKSANQAAKEERKETK